MLRLNEPFSLEATKREDENQQEFERRAADLLETVDSEDGIGGKPTGFSASNVIADGRFTYTVTVTGVVDTAAAPA